MLIAMSKCYQFSPNSYFQELPFTTRHLRHPERNEKGIFDRYLHGRVAESKLKGDVPSFWPISCEILHTMKLNVKGKENSFIIAALEDLPANYIQKQYFIFY